MRSPTFQPLTTVCFHTRYAPMLYSFSPFFFWINLIIKQRIILFSEVFGIICKYYKFFVTLIYKEHFTFSKQKFVILLFFEFDIEFNRFYERYASRTLSLQSMEKNSDRKVRKFVNSFDKSYVTEDQNFNSLFLFQAKALFIIARAA